ncbi:MAG: DUF975 family protein [Clostridia bacterium]|nr:DUF975 family protein [Clostridia bacterium]
MLASETRKLAREALSGKWGKAALITLVYLLITWVIGFVLNFIPVVGPIAQIVIDVPLAFGLVATLIKLKRGEDVSYTGFLTDGFNCFANSWKVALWTFVKLLIPIVVFIVALVILFIGTGVTTAGAIASSSSATGAGGAVAVLGFLAMIAASIWLTVKSFYYQLTSFILFDNLDKDAKAIVEESESLMKGNRWRLFCLQFSFIGWSILASLTFGIGMLWLMPYMLVAEVVFYEALAGKDSKVEAEVTSDNSTEPIQEDNNDPISEA